VVQPCERLDEHVDALVAIFVAASGEEVQGVGRIEVIMTVEVAADEVVYLLLGLLVKVLEFMGSCEFGDVHAVGENTIRWPSQQVLALIRGDVRNRREDVGRVGSCAFHAISVVDAATTGLLVNVEALQIVVKINRSSAQIAAKQGCVRGEDGGDIDAALFAQGERNSGQPLVEMRNDGSFRVMADVLRPSEGHP